ncbi:MAG: amidohydrolase [Woeseia sp.]|nr:amidohydrolase [Woeseia sp.]|tara:strand:- start:1994 stop:5302 length:3309 start_codon:yes stop_codon:yes gene_type:complete
MMTKIYKDIFVCVLSIVVMGFPFAAETKEKGDTLPLQGKTETLSFSTDEGSWLSIDISPNGKTLIFDLLGDLYVLPLHGGKAERITSGLGFDSQAMFSPNGEWIAFISDRSGSDNLWIARPDGSDARKLSEESQADMISPAWTPDSLYVVVSKDSVESEITMYHVNGGTGVKLNGQTNEDEIWGVGVTISPDGKYAYYAKDETSNGPVRNFPAAQISRYDFATGAIDKITNAEGGGLRPELSPDGKWLVYGTRHKTQTGLRIRNLITGSDRWLTYPIQRDAQENYRPPSRDVLPGYSFTPDGASIALNSEGKIWLVDVVSGKRSNIPFSADVSLDIGPDLSSPYRVPQGDVTATIVHDPRLSPDGAKIAASVLTKIYVLDSKPNSTPKRLTSAEAWEYKPVWSPDGRWIAYVTWSIDNGGQIWRMRSNGRGQPQQLTDIPAFYTDLVYSKDGRTLYAMRGNEYMRRQTFSEFGGLRVDLELVSVSASGGKQTVIASANSARYPHFGPEADRIYMTDSGTLFSTQLNGTDRREHLTVSAPRGNRGGDEPPKAEAIYISPNGHHALAFANKQVWAIGLAKTGGQAPVVKLRGGSLPVLKLTDIGADFSGWTNDGTSIWWAIGKSFYTRPLSSIAFRIDESNNKEPVEDSENKFVLNEEHESAHERQFSVTVARNTPSGSMLIKGATVISMSESQVTAMESGAKQQDILIVNNRIETIGNSRNFNIPANTKIVNADGKYIVPGFIDTHAHWEFRTDDVLEPQNWSLVANLAYGVTAGLDVQTSSHDYLAYRDMVETGQSVGQRAFMTGRGIFGDTDFQSYDTTHAYLRRYSDHYNTKNIKSYLAGNRQQRQWIVLASKALGLMPTTEGGGDQRLDLTHAIDGMHGNEHTLPDSPFFTDVVELYSKTKTAYTPTLVVQYNATSMREYFFARSDVYGNEKLRRFTPDNRLDELTERRPVWVRSDQFDFKHAAAQAAKIQRAGGLVGIGGHGELQGLAYHWEMWGFEMGGMKPIEVLKAATIDGARIIGVEQDLGSIEVGKLADMVILNADPLADIRNTVKIQHVIIDGRLYDGTTLDQLWPEQKALAPFWWWNKDDVRFATQPVNNQ